MKRMKKVLLTIALMIAMVISVNNVKAADITDKVTNVGTKFTLIDGTSEATTLWAAVPHRIKLNIDVDVTTKPAAGDELVIATNMADLFDGGIINVSDVEVMYNGITPVGKLSLSGTELKIVTFVF